MSNLSKKIAAIIAGSIATLTPVESNAMNTTAENIEPNADNYILIGKKKPMPVLKMNLFNPENSQFVASHTSHASHRSHSSHYSHRSGAMFS